MLNLQDYLALQMELIGFAHFARNVGSGTQVKVNALSVILIIAKCVHHMEPVMNAWI